MMEKINRFDWLIWLPALSVAVMLRKDIGGRMLHRGYITGVSAVMYLLGLSVSPRDGQVGLCMYAIVVFVAGMTYAIKRWWEFNRGKKQHSCYIGTSPFEFRWLPAFFKINRRMARFGDPVFAVLCGALVIPFSGALGLWLMFSGACLITVEAAAHRRQRDREIEMVDGLVYSEYQGRTVERFEQAPTKQQQQQDAIATGLDDDIARKIRQKKQNPPRN
ncbi:MAG TPA: hypothetical protein VG347_09310 [Verrucomicrobiae bacterium]|nr:hypothetical protein [Verrucomicrobiae bacterium]